MSKYGKFDIEKYPDAYVLIGVHRAYSMYEAVNLGRYVLVRNDLELAFKNKADFPPTIDRWVKSWEKNAKKQLDSIQVRVNTLLDERDEILSILTGVLNND